MPELVVGAVVSSSELRRALSPGEADEHGDVEGDRLTVDDEETAEMLVETYPNVDWASERVETDTAPEPTVDRAELDADGATYTCGVNDCSREVDSPTETCWQHEPDEDDGDE